jgi:hypothetical protein
MFTFCVVETATPVPTKVAVEDPAGTVTEPGTVRLALSLEMDTTVPVPAADASSVTVQLAEAAPCRELGVQEREDTCGRVVLESVTVPPVPVTG